MRSVTRILVSLAMAWRVVGVVPAAIEFAVSSFRHLRSRLRTLIADLPFCFPCRLLLRMPLSIGLGLWSRPCVGERLMALSAFLPSYLLRRALAARADTSARGFPAHEGVRDALSLRTRAHVYFSTSSYPERPVVYPVPPPLLSSGHVLGPRSGGTTGAALGQGLGLS